MCYEKEKPSRRADIFDAGGIGNKNIAHGPEITTVCYEIEKPSRRAYVFERGSLVDPNVLCGCVRDRCTGVAHG